jgi:HSP20 family protein
MAIVMDPVAPWQRDRLFTTGAGLQGFIPLADVLVSEDTVTVIMDVPGLRADDLEIELERDQLSVRGERRPLQDDDGRAVRRVERGFGRFERTIRVPPGLDPDQVRAELADGVLTITIPRPKPPEPRRIQVSAESNAQRDD